MITDYASLQAEAMREAQRRDLASIMPSLIQRAEAAIFRELDLYQITAQAAGTGGAFALPADVGQVEALLIDEGGGRQRMLDYIPSADGLRPAGATPSFYTIEASTVRLLPAPGGDVTYTLHYAPKIEPLGTGTPTNWLLANAPDVYLYRTCVQIGIHTHDDALITRHSQFFNDAIQALRNKDARARLARRGGLRMRPRSAV